MATWDSERVALLYTKEALFVGSLPGLRQGKLGVCDYFSSIPGRRVQLCFKDKTIVSLSEGCLLVSGVALFEQEIEGAADQLERRLSLVLEKKGNAWLIALHHVSLIPSDAGEFLY